MVVFGNLAISCERDIDVQTVRLLGELDAANAGGLQLELQRIQAGDAGMIIIDFSELTLIDATGARLILSTCARAREGAHGLTLRGASAVVRHELETASDGGRLPFAD